MSTIQKNDARVTLNPQDAQALAGAMAALNRIPAAPLARPTIEALWTVEAAAKAEAASTELLGSRGESRRADFRRLRITQQVERAQRAAIKEFAFPRGWKYEGPLGVSELHNESLSRTWCETCGGLCQADPIGHYLHDTHRTGLHDALRNRRDYCGRTEAVIQHTQHPFSNCQVFAARFGLKVTQLDWSWYGPEFTAVIFERARR
jgi:hypothetical protein